MCKVIAILCVFVIVYLMFELVYVCCHGSPCYLDKFLGEGTE